MKWRVTSETQLGIMIALWLLPLVVYLFWRDWRSMLIVSAIAAGFAVWFFLVIKLVDRFTQ